MLDEGQMCDIYSEMAARPALVLFHSFATTDVTSALSNAAIHEPPLFSGAARVLSHRTSEGLRDLPFDGARCGCLLEAQPVPSTSHQQGDSPGPSHRRVVEAPCVDPGMCWLEKWIPSSLLVAIR